MKNTIYYIFQEKPSIVVYFLCFLFLLVCYPYSNSFITREFKTISKYSDNEIMIRYNQNEYKIYEKGEYVLHGNLITIEDKSESSFIPTWFFVQFSLLVVNLFVLFKNGDFKKNKIDTYFAMQNVYVDPPRERGENFKYIYDGKVFYEYIMLLSCNSTLYESLEKYIKTPEDYEDYV